MPPAISFSVWAWGNGYRARCGSVVGADKGALVPVGEGTKIASMLGQANLTFRQRRP